MKILILGIGNAQIDAIEYLKSWGFEIHGASYLKEGPGLCLINRFVQLDIKDKEGVLNYARQNEIDLVYSVGSDIAMPTIGYVSDKLGLPSFVDEKTAVLLNNKSLLRNFLCKNGFPKIYFKSVDSLSELIDWNIFPAIMKPVDNQGQRGVFKIYNKSQIPELFDISKSFSRSGKVIIEQYIEGKEISVNAFIFRGKLIYSFISDRLVIDHQQFSIIKGHYLKSKIDKELKRKVRKIILNTIDKFNIKNGPLYFQLMYNKNLEISVIEIAARLDGCHIWKLIELKYGVNLIKLSFDLLINGNNNFPFPALKKKIKEDLLLDFYLLPPNSKFVKINEIDGDLLSLNYYYKNGDKIKTINGILEKAGYRILKISMSNEFKNAV